MKTRKILKIRTIEVMFSEIVLLFLILYGLVYGSANLRIPMPESEYPEFLDVASALTEANYRKIKTWQGNMSIQEYNYFYDEQCRNLQIDPNDLAVHSNRIRRNMSALVEFATDIQNNKLYSKLIPTVNYESLDSNSKIITKEKYSPIISIVTSNEYLSYKPNYTYGYKKETVTDGKWVGSNAFRLPLEQIKGEQWGHIRDPRNYFCSDNKTVWELLLSLHDLIVSPPNDIPAGKSPIIYISTEETENRTLTFINGKFYGSPGCTYEGSFINVIMTFDDSVGMNLVHREVMDKAGNVLQTMDITYEKIDDVFLPKTINFKMFRPTDQNLKFDSQITFTKAIVNAPIPEETFSYSALGLNDGDRFTDEVENKEYKYNINAKNLEVISDN